jgi:hypothetical protein
MTLHELQHDNLAVINRQLQATLSIKNQLTLHLEAAGLIADYLREQAGV